MIVLAWCCLAISLISTNASAIKNFTKSESDLVSVVVLYRHGDRTPSSSFPNDPYFDQAYWPMGFGQLTKRGKQRQYELGKWLRKRYNSFLPPEYSPKDIYVRSTDVDRTLMSAASNLAGLYPPVTSQTWNKTLAWQPVPVHTIPLEEDQALYMGSKCNRFDFLYNSQSDANFFVNVNRQYADFYSEISNLTGWKVDDIDYLGQLQAVLYVYSSYNASYLPSWATSLDHDKLEYLAGLNFARYTFTPELKRLGAGPFFDYLLDHLDQAVTNSTVAPKLLMLSGHESTIAAVLNSMDLFDFKAPAFASCLIWELRKTGDVYFINMFYKKNSTQDVPDELELNNCGVNCEYYNYRDFLEPIRVNMTTWSSECLN